MAGAGGCTEQVPRRPRRSRSGGSRGVPVPVLVPAVRASPAVPSVVRGSFVVKFFLVRGERHGGGEEEQGRERARDRPGAGTPGAYRPSSLLRRGPGMGGDYRYAAREASHKDVDVQLLLFESFGGFGRRVREILRKAADVLL